MSTLLIRKTIIYLKEAQLAKKTIPAPPTRKTPPREDKTETCRDAVATPATDTSPNYNPQGRGGGK